MPASKCILYKAIVFRQISPCLLLTLHLQLICLRIVDRGVLALTGHSGRYENVIHPSSTGMSTLLFYCTVHIKGVTQLRFFCLRAILQLSSSLSRIRKVRDIMAPYLSAVMACCWLPRDGLGRFLGFTAGSLVQLGWEFQGTQEQHAVTVGSRVCTQREPQLCSPFNRVTQCALQSTLPSLYHFHG